MAKPSDDVLRRANHIRESKSNASIEELEEALSIYVWCALSGECTNDSKHQKSIQDLTNRIKRKKEQP